MSLEDEFEVGERKYRARRMSVFDAFNVATDFREVLLGLSLLDGQRNSGEMKLTDDQHQRSVDVIMTGARGAAPHVRDRVITSCLAVVSRKQPTGWAPMVSQDGQLMFQDMDLREMSRVVYRVLRHNGLIDFFDAGPRAGSIDGPRTDQTGQLSRTEKTG